MMKYRVICGLILAASMIPPAIAFAAEEGRLIDRIVAVVEDDAVMNSELDERVAMLKRRFSHESVQLPPEAQLRRQVLERMIIERLQVQTAGRRGIRIDELTLNEAMRKLAQRNNLSLEAFRDKLVKDGIDYVKFREQIRTELIIDRLRARVIDRKIQVSDQEVDDLIATQRGGTDGEAEYRLRHILITVPEAAIPEQVQAAREKIESIRERAVGGEDFSQLAISESHGQNALEGGDLGWRTTNQLPSLFSRVVINMAEGDVSDIIRSPSGFHLVRLEARKGDSRTVIQQTQVRHILIKTSAVVDDEKARLRLTNLRNRIVSNEEDFAELARAHSDDGATAVDGGDLGWVSPGELVPELEDVMNGLQPGQISEPFRTTFGWHVVEVLERREYDGTDEALRAQAQDIVRRRKTEEETELWLRRLRDESYVEYRLAAPEQG